MLNPDAPIPLYRQLADELEERIYSGNLVAGERIPSENELATLHGIGRPTVRQATDHLVRRGLLERRRGSGTYVLAQGPEVDLFTLVGTNAAFEVAGLELRTVVVEAVRYIERFDADAGPLADRPGYAYARLGRVGGDPVLLERMYLEGSVFPSFDAHRVDQEPLSRLVGRNYHRRPLGGHQTIRAHQLEMLEATLLEVATGHTALLLERTLDFSNARAALFTRIFALTDRVVLAQSLTEPLCESYVVAKREEIV